MRTESREGLAAATVEALASSRSEKPGVLVIHQDALMRVMVQLGLQRLGFDVWGAANGQEGIKLYRAERARIDAVLLDLPEVDGCATLHSLRIVNPGVRACLMRESGGEADRWIQRGAAYVFAKPIELDHLAGVLRLMVRSPATKRPSRNGGDR